MANGIVLNIDTTKSEFQNPMVQLRQGDGNYQSLDVTVTSNGEPFDLTGWTTIFMGTTAGGFKIIDSAVTVTNALQGSFTYTPTKAWGQDQGEFKNAYFKFTKADETASGASFRVNVLDAVDLTAEEAGDYISVVDGIINELTTDLNTLQTSVDDLKAQNLAIKTTDNTWTGANTFNKKIISPAGVQGNTDTATKLQMPRKINGTDFDGTSDINVPASNDDNLVHRTGNETVDGNKTFTGDTIFSSTLTAPQVIATDLLTGFHNVIQVPKTITKIIDLINNEFIKGRVFWKEATYIAFNTLLSDAPTNDSYSIIKLATRGSNCTYVEYSDLSGNVWHTTATANTLNPWVKQADNSTVVHNTGTESVAGDKTFTGLSTFTQAINGKLLGKEIASGTDLYTLFEPNQKFVSKTNDITATLINKPVGLTTAFGMFAVETAGSYLDDTVGKGVTLIIVEFDKGKMYTASLFKDVSGSILIRKAWTEIPNDNSKLVHNTGTEVINGDKTFMSGSYGLRVTSSGVQKTSNGGGTWTNI